MDWESIGLIYGAARATRRHNRQIAEADGEVDKANAEIEKADRIIAAKNKVIADDNAYVDKLWRKYDLEAAHSAGLTALTNAFRAALRQSAPNHPLLQKTGRVFVADGKAETNSRSIYNEAFDAKAKALGLANPETLRAAAK
jgi:hypothetical protein